MHINKQLATEAAAQALRLRKRLGIPISESVSALDVAERLDIEVRLIDIPSMEGVYVAGSAPTILLSSLRPQGRRNFTCAHEIGHHIFGHGEQFDELTDEKSSMRKSDPKEFSADCFAAYFLMPKSSIENGMKCRGYTYEFLVPTQVYALASWLGVGYSTLVNHLRYGIGTISRNKAQELQRSSPKDIRQELLGYSTATPLHLADEHWIGRAIDCEVGDCLMLPYGSYFERGQLAVLNTQRDSTLIEAQSSGVARAGNEQLGWSAFVRVSPHEFTGRACYRFEEEVAE